MYNYVHTLNIRNVLAGRRLDAENAIVIFSVGESFFFLLSPLLQQIAILLLI